MNLFILLQRLLPQHLISRLVGYVANSNIRWLKNICIRIAIRKYSINLSEAQDEDINSYPSFNHFFTRQLKDGARPVSGTICSPADGSISAIGSVNGESIVQAKGINYSVNKLLAKENCTAYQQGSFATIYLSPKDYHRVHCPSNAILRSARYVPGKLFSVNQATTEGLKDLFAINERLVMEFDSNEGKMAVIMVGAMIVAAIQPIWRDRPYKAKTLIKEDFDTRKKFNIGDELGQFQMGSTVIILTENRINWQRETN